MFWRMAADALVVIHLGFILFVMLGGLLLLRWPSLIWLHVPAVAWGVIVECLHLGCPLTLWENQLRRMAGQAGYEGRLHRALSDTADPIRPGSPRLFSCGWGPSSYWSTLPYMPG